MASKKKTAPKAATVNAVRAELATLMRATLADEAARHDWTYDAIRPLAVPSSWKPGQKVVGDCSKGVQYLCRWAGAPDPMGNGFAAWGNSSTIAAHLSHLAKPSQLLVGDVVTFGPGGSKHAAIVLEAGGDPLLWSFGHQGAPNTYRLSTDGREHQLLRLPVEASPVVAPTVLRARTGYWAWVAWRLGEGDWKPYGATDGQVRPDVPRLIPVAWWRLLSAFLLARKKGNKPTTAA